MATRKFADLSSYRQALNQPQVSPLDAALQGLQQGLQLPQTIQDQQLQRQLQAAIAQQKLTDLANPELAIQRTMQANALDAILSGRNPNLVFEPQVSPELQAMRQTALDQAGVPPPTTDFRQVVPGINGLPAIGLSPSAGAQAVQNELNNKLALLNARPVNMVLTKEGLAFNPREGTASDVFINDQSVSNQRRTNVEADAKAKADAAQALATTKGAQASELQEDKQNFTAQENEKNRVNRLTLADKRSKIAQDVPVAASAYQAERQGRVLASVDDLEKDVGYDTVGFADWFKGVPTTEAKSFAGRLKTLKAAIAFGELTAMREASKTGGALGQVSNIELGLLESALGNLDQAQSPSDFKEELGKIRDSIKRWQAASAKAPSGAQPPPAGSSAVERLRKLHQVK